VAELLTLVVIGVGTYAMRAAFLVTARRQPPALLARLLPHIGPAVLAAITLPALIAPRGSISIADTVPALLAAAISVVAWRRTKSVPAAEWPSGGLRPGRSAPLIGDQYGIPLRELGSGEFGARRGVRVERR
jgi:branched-subunit amino acid transport protein